MTGRVKCDHCDTPRAVTLGSNSLCETHYATEIDKMFAGQIGVGATIAAAPGWPPGWRQAQCTLCNATWTACQTQACPWCLDRYHQHTNTFATLTSDPEPAR